MRKAAAETAAVCADCFRPLAPDASVTLTSRFIEHLPARTGGLGHYIAARDVRQRVPICLHCWLDEIVHASNSFHLRGFRQDGPIDRAGPAPFLFGNELRRLRCEWCERPIRIESRKHSRLSLRNRCCCAECLHKVELKRANERRRVRHDERPCEVCGTMFVPTQSTAKTCSNTCRQRLFRHRHSDHPTDRANVTTAAGRAQGEPRAKARKSSG